MAEESVRSSVEEEQEEQELYDVTTRWVIPEKIEHMAFIGKNVLAIATDVYIIFFNYKNNTEVIYTPNCKEKGDGVDCIATHKNRVFVFAEKVNHARIFVIIYPTFEILAEFSDLDVNRYKALCMTEMDLVVGFSGFPDYVMTGWNWRTKQRLICVPTDVIRRDQIYLSSNSHMMVVECWGSGLHVWELAMCYRRALVLRRSTLEERCARERQGPRVVGVCWSQDALLYAVDDRANIYNVLSDNINSILTLEWSEEIEGDEKPCFCTFGNGLLLYGPDHNLRCLKKGEDKSWVVAAVIPQRDVILKLIANSNNDMCAIYTARGVLYWVQGMEDNPMITPCCFKQRNILKAQLIAPTYEYVVLIDHGGTLVVYDIATAQLITILQLKGNDISIQTSPVDPLIVAYGEVGTNYGMKLLTLRERRLVEEGYVCLSNQIVSHVAFSSSGRGLVVAAMAAGHVFLYNVSESYKLTLVRYTELGRGLADCILMPVSGILRCFNIVLFSDKYKIGERITCINAETGRDNKFAGKMQGPYSRLLPLGNPNEMLAVPHLSRNFHILKLAADKGITVTVRMGAIINTGLDIKCYDAFFNTGALVTFGYDGHVILRQPHAPAEYDLKLVATHRYNNGIRQALIDDKCRVLVTLGENGTLCVRHLNPQSACDEAVQHDLPLDTVLAEGEPVELFPHNEKNYLDILEEKRVHEEAMDYKRQRDEVIKFFHIAQKRLVELLEENINEVPLHQLSLSEFNLHFENKKERYKEAEKDRETIRLKTEARIRAQDEVTEWIKKTCWDSMATHRTKILGIFTHYQVENYACIPAERESWPELQLVEAYRSIEAENDAELFRPWEEYDPEKDQPSLESAPPPAPVMDAKASQSLRSMTTSMRDMRKSFESAVSMTGGGGGGATLDDEESLPGEPAALAGTSAHLYITSPPYSVPQALRYSYLHMELCKHLCRLTVHKMRFWFNKEFDALQVLKRREVGLVAERNARLRFIIEELNKLSDLRESFHHLTIVIQDPQWMQEEEPERLIRVEPEECSIEPYISPSQIVIIPPDPGPKDDFRERALIEMMDGVLEKLWHEEIKKPIPPPQCMLDKSPEHFNEEDLRQVFEWEKKVEFRKEERNKYRKMLHAEYAKLSGVLNDGIVKFNEKVKELYLTKLRVDAVIGQESLLLMRQRRVNLDRIEAAEKTEVMRSEISRYEHEIVKLQEDLKIIQQQSDECQLAYEALQVRDKQLERAFKNAFNDLSPVIMDQCAKFYRKRPKWHMHTLSPSVMYELAATILAGAKPPPSMYPECLDYIKALEHLDQPTSMPAMLDESSWATIVRMRRNKIELEIRSRAIVTETAAVDVTFTTWSKAIQARKSAAAKLHDDMLRHRQHIELTARNKTIQLVMPAGQVEITTTGHFEDFDDAALVLREEIQTINDLILKVGALKLRMMRRQIEFRKGILAKEWLHAQMKMKLRHAEQELYSYRRLKIPKELQLFLKNKQLGYTEEFEYQRMEKEMEASRVSVTRILDIHIQAHNELQFRITSVELKIDALTKVITKLNVKASENRINEDPLEPIRIRKKLKKRMEVIVERSRLIRQVQQNHSAIVLKQTELELLRLKTYPTLASFEILS